MFRRWDLITLRGRPRRSMSVGFVLAALLAGILAPASGIAADPIKPTAKDAPAQCQSAILGARAPQIATTCPILVQPLETSLPTGFQESIVWSGLNNPTAIRFATDGRVFVSEKSGVIKVYAGLSDPTPTVFSSLTTNVQNFWDRGLLGLALDSSLTGGGGPPRPYIYVLYTFDHILGSTANAPRWGDTCPNPPGAGTDGCVVSGRLSRFDVSGTTISGQEQVLIEDWCQQYPSHSIGSLAFGSDGALYVSGGDGASFNAVDYGQWGGSLSGTPTSVNPCGDPPAAAMTPPTAEGGALRSQDLRTPADPTSLDGAILRIDPTTGAAMPDNPMIGSTDPNARRIIAYGLRNPFRFTLRPNTNELWFGDVGWSTWEEVNRVADVTDGVVENFGWPCYEGAARQSGYDNANVSLCENLYAAGTSAITAPVYAYDHAVKVISGETCPIGSSAIAGMAFYPESGGSFPAAYRGGLFFADHNRSCIWFMPKGSNGQPDPNQRQAFAPGAPNPVDLQIGPNGDLFYVDFEGGAIRRISPVGANQSPTARIVATPESGTVPLTVAFDGRTSTDPEGGTLTYRWDLDGDGAYDDSTSATPSWQYTSAGSVTVRLEVTDPASNIGTTSKVITAGAANTPPVPVISTPTVGTTWSVGQSINFSGSATDTQDGVLAAAKLSWTLVLQHCPSNCHPHQIQAFPGVASGSFSAPDHEYPSYLELTLTATDSAGASASVTRRLDPRTVNLNFATVPAGLDLTVGGVTAATPFSRTVIEGSQNSISAPTPQNTGGRNYTFSSWSDGGAASHTITALPGGRYIATLTQGEKLKVVARADANVRSKEPAKNFGTTATLRVKEARHRSYLKFDIPAFEGTVLSAKLRLYVANRSGNGGSAYLVSNHWKEKRITWDRAPSIDGSPLSTAGAAEVGTWVEFDVALAVIGGRTISVALSDGSGNAVHYASRGVAHPPRLVIRTIP